jgi:beta-lactamase regulating signal transducer with metallopeptidase domain
MISSHRQFVLLTVILGIIGLAPAVVLVGAGMYFQQLATHTDVWRCACGAIELMTHPRAGTISTVLFSAAGAWMVWLLLRATALYARHDRHIQFLKQHEYAQSSSDGVLVHHIASDVPQALTAGLFTPSIYITDAARAHLSSAEYRAVIAHELHHVRRHDAVWTMMVGVIAQAYGWIPAIQRLVEQWTILREVTADQAATNEYTNARGLAGALLKMSAPHVQHSAAFSPNIVRIDALLHPQRPIVTVRWRAVALAALLLIVVVGIGVQAGTAWATAPTTTAIRQCQEIHSMCRELQAQSLLMFTPRTFTGYVLP